jgi:NADH pyrophosphatase NudC (nudix superfamily)
VKEMRVYQPKIFLSCNNLGLCRSLVLGLLFLSLGCVSTSPRAQTSEISRGESREESLSAATAVLEAVSGQDVTEKDLKNLAQQMQKNPEAQSAVESISNAFDPSRPKIKYCPVCGKRYRFTFEECPIHHVPLKILED